MGNWTPYLRPIGVVMLPGVDRLPGIRVTAATLSDIDTEDRIKALCMRMSTRHLPAYKIAPVLHAAVESPYEPEEKDTDRPPPRGRACYYCGHGPVFLEVADKPPICVACQRRANRMRK